MFLFACFRFYCGNNYSSTSLSLRFPLLLCTCTWYVLKHEEIIASCDFNPTSYIAVTIESTSENSASDFPS